MSLHTAYYSSPLGLVRITGNEKGIQDIHLGDAENTGQTATVHPSLQTCLTQLEEYFNNARTTFDVLLNPQGTAFQQRVWKELQQIPYGKTRSYLDMSRLLGDEKVIRAAAAANGQNPIAILIPCHRVIGSNGSLTGYAGGLWRKEWLLKHEGALPKQQLSLFA